MKKRILHIVEWNFWGGVQSSVLSLIREFNECDNHVFQLYRKKNDITFNFFKKYGVEINIIGEKLKESHIKRVDPDIIVLHSIRDSLILIPEKFFNNYYTITIHHYLNHNYLGDLNWFVSKYIYNITQNKPKNYIIQPPPIFIDDFLNIERPKRKPVVGRIQSTSMLMHGKYPDSFYCLLNKLDSKTFIVGPKDGDAPMVPGKMPEYLREVDIFVIWGETPETWSLVASEANISGIPVVARRMNDGLTEQLEKSGGGILVDTEEEFVDTVNVLINNENKRNEIAKKGKYWCLENTSSKLARGYL